jgi:hypothetical protein
MNEHNSAAGDDKNGNCKICGHPFNPHAVIAYDGNDLSKGGKCAVRLKAVIASVR